MNRVVYVQAHFAPIYTEKTVTVPTGEKTRGFFGGEKDITREEKQSVQTGSSHCKVDGARLAKDVEAAVTALNREGYEVIGITPITSGDNYKNLDAHHSVWVGYGWSYTEAVLIVARRLPVAIPAVKNA